MRLLQPCDDGRTCLPLNLLVLLLFGLRPEYFFLDGGNDPVNAFFQRISSIIHDFESIGFWTI